MTIPAWAVWVFGLVLVPMALGVGRNLMLTQRLMWMHEHPEKTGFGTVGHKDSIDANTRAIREQTHYLRWLAKRQTGDEPPPFVET